MMFKTRPEALAHSVAGTVTFLTGLIQAKDQGVRGHCSRVSDLAVSLARHVGLDDAACNRIRLAGLLHDVGKVGVSEAVLNKQGPLSAEELQQIQRHPLIGHRLLQRFDEVADALEGVLSHHERWDGTGYPFQRAGDSIPVDGRILAIADSFDAMTSDRTYRRAMGMHEALNEVKRCRGTQFDPELAEAFIDIHLDAAAA
jgi:putative nucleotidyltransferase with HDIG domain